MNKRFYYFIIFVVVSQLLLCSAGFAKSDKPKKSAKAAITESNQPAAPAENQPQASAPSNARIKFDAPSHDFGKVGPDTNNDCKFKFTNVK